MTIILAPDSFKESMTAKEVCNSMEKGIHKVNSTIKCIKVPMADGGEGTMQSLIDATGGSIHRTEVLDPLGRTISAQFGICGNGEIAVLEMASASGLHHVTKNERDPTKTSTYGTGQLISACLDHNIKKLLIGIGGSATNDAGAGMLQALGGKLLDKNKKSIKQGGGNLNKIETIDLSGLDKRLKEVDIEVACDVSNLLTGEEGATHIFGPQKGATKNMIKLLDSNLYYFSKIVEDTININMREIIGGGAAGGLGAALHTFLGGKLKKGIDMVIEYSGLEEQIKNADMVWTGEGSLDSQTIYGKTPFGVATLAKKYDIPVIAIAGRLGQGSEILYKYGFDGIFSIINDIQTLPEALLNGRHNVESTSENIMRILSIK